MPQTIVTHRDGVFRHDGDLLRSMAALVAPSYLDDPDVLASDVRRCDTLHTLSDENGLVAFFLVGNCCLRVDGKDVPSQFLGLSATRQDTKNSAVVWQLYTSAIAEQRELSRSSAGALFLFATLATPSSYHAMSTLWTDVQPNAFGELTEEEAPRVRAAAEWLGCKSDPIHAFLLRSCYPRTRYSAIEQARIARIIEKTDFSLFRRVGLDERAGDRIIVTCRLRSQAVH